MPVATEASMQNWTVLSPNRSIAGPITNKASTAPVPL